ncbi:MAG: hypothetical protein H3C43_11320 [Leptonema sp. (in: Bacteria)]|nr:hypothetical protein [Leptonema sp. (in: bacteria)]
MRLFIIRFSYSLLLYIVWPMYSIAQFFSKQARQFATTRKEGKATIQEFLSSEVDVTEFRFWLHASSVGELDQAIAVARSIRKNRKYKNSKILITGFSLSIKKLPTLPEANLSCYLPLDYQLTWSKIFKNQNRSNTQNTKDRKITDFSNLIFITFTWDVYPNLLFQLKKVNSKSFLCSAALSKDSWRLKYSFWLQPVYNLFDGIGAVDQPNKTRFLQLLNDQDRVQVTGDSRYDTVFYKLENSKLTDANLKPILNIKSAFILASTYNACDQQLFPELPTWLKAYPNRDLWIFPHHIDEHRLKECEANLANYGIQSHRFSELIDSPKSRVVVVDQLGLLAHCYSKTAYCYVGGGFHHRVHNTAEPAALGSVIVTGPKINSSPIAVQLEEIGGLFRRYSGKEIFDTIDELEQNKKRLASLSKANRDYLKSQLGSSDRFLKFIESMFYESSS